MDMQTCIYHISKNRKLLACYFAFPRTFFPFAYPKKPVHCQNTSIIFNTLPDACGPPESIRTANVKALLKTEWLLVFLSPSHFQKEINK